MLTHFNHDDFGEIENGEKTYDSIIKGLSRGTSVIIGWTDAAGTHLDILFTISPIQAGSLQRGMSSATDLFVAVSGFGFFGFDIKSSERYPSYVGEKLGLGTISNPTTEKLAELINAICRKLSKWMIQN
jgi:hypothetical protein